MLKVEHRAESNPSLYFFSGELARAPSVKKEDLSVPTRTLPTLAGKLTL